MPELPEVESVRSSLQDNLPGVSITDVEVLREKTLLNVSEAEFRDKIKGQTFGEVMRRAKYLFLHLASSSRVISVHLKMTGAFLFQSSEIGRSSHLRLIFGLDNGYQLRFRDIRAFAKVGLFEDMDAAYDALRIHSLAPEPLDDRFTVRYLTGKLSSYHSVIKALLLDQHKVVSGLGNIYVDESLFVAGIRPDRLADSLTAHDCHNLHAAIQKIISQALKMGGTTVRDYMNANGQAGLYSSELNVYGQRGQPCKICHNEISHIKLAGRGTHFCQHCQS